MLKKIKLFCALISLFTFYSCSNFEQNECGKIVISFPPKVVEQLAENNESNPSDFSFEIYVKGDYETSVSKNLLSPKLIDDITVSIDKIPVNSKIQLNAIINNGEKILYSGQTSLVVKDGENIVNLTLYNVEKENPDSSNPPSTVENPKYIYDAFADEKELHNDKECVFAELCDKGVKFTIEHPSEFGGDGWGWCAIGKLDKFGEENDAIWTTQAVINTDNKDTSELTVIYPLCEPNIKNKFVVDLNSNSGKNLQAWIVITPKNGYGAIDYSKTKLNEQKVDLKFNENGDAVVSVSNYEIPDLTKHKNNVSITKSTASLMHGNSEYITKEQSDGSNVESITVPKSNIGESIDKNSIYAQYYQELSVNDSQGILEWRLKILENKKDNDK